LKARNSLKHSETILSHSLDLLYCEVNDLPLIIQGEKLILYADDTNILFINRNEEALQTKLSLVVKQLENWVLKMIFL
jgi:hypothetical protein